MIEIEPLIAPGDATITRLRNELAIDIDDIKLGAKLGQGTFGTVFAADWHDNKVKFKVQSGEAWFAGSTWKW